MRFVAREASLTPAAKAPGRGVYTCRRLACFERARASAVHRSKWRFGQDAARTLELLDTGPVIVEPVKKFWMDRIGGFYAPFILRFPALRRKLLGLAAIEVHEGLRHGIPRNEQR